MKSICPFVRGGYYEYNSQYMGQVPVSSNTEYRHELSKSVLILLKNHKKILFNKIPESEKNEIEKKIISEENKINSIVYKLYNITDEEKKIIESSL